MPAQIKITKRTVDRITGDGSDRFYWDDDLPGFGLRVRASGRKYYVVQFRANGRLRRMTLGRHGAVTPETARRRAMALISEAKGGKDPAALRDKGRKAATMKNAGQAVFGRVRPGPLQAEHGLRVPAFGEVLHRPQDRNPQGDGDPAERHRRTAPWHAGHALSGQPDPRGAFKNVQLGRVVGSASGTAQTPVCTSSATRRRSANDS